MLTDQNTKIEDLEKEKAKLEARIQQISNDFNIVISDKNTLAEKIHMFQTKCRNLEDMLKRNEDETSEALRKL